MKCSRDGRSAEIVVAQPQIERDRISWTLRIVRVTGTTELDRDFLAATLNGSGPRKEIGGCSGFRNGYNHAVHPLGSRPSAELLVAIEGYFLTVRDHSSSGEKGRSVVCGFWLLSFKY
jgi:hypothetical protein